MVGVGVPRCLIIHATRPASTALRVGYADGLRPSLTPAMASRTLAPIRGTGAVRRAKVAEVPHLRDVAGPLPEST
jgi:hypothetical protein